jgi:hypothetical protein
MYAVNRPEYSLLGVSPPHYVCTPLSGILSPPPHALSGELTYLVILGFPAKVSAQPIKPIFLGNYSSFRTRDS